MKLNLGCALDIKEGYINVDLFCKHPAVINEDISQLSFVDNETVDEIYARDIIEHMPLNEAISCLGTWYKYLKVGGTIFIQTTNFEMMRKAQSCHIWDIKILNHMLFAGVSWINQDGHNCDFHKSVYSSIFLKKELEKIGYKIISIEEDKIDEELIRNPYSHNLNTKIWARK